MDIFPITAEALLSFAGGLVIAAIAGLWLKHYLKDWRFTPLLVLGVTEALLCGARLVLTPGATGVEWANTVAIALFAASLETFGYESVLNILGIMGHGRRAS
jgi:hypothetical protein